IVGDLPRFTAVSIGWHDDVNDARDDIAHAIERVQGDEGVLLLTDMLGVPPNISVSRRTPSSPCTRSIACAISSRASFTSSCQPIETAVNRGRSPTIDRKSGV